MTTIKDMSILGDLFKRRSQKTLLIGLWEEVNRNLERYYVVEQRQFITEPFDSEVWEQARAFSGYHFPQELFEYAAAIQDFNQAWKQVRDFEEVYSSNIEQKTRDNAEVLHAMKEALQEKFDMMRPKIAAAQSSMRNMLDR